MIAHNLKAPYSEPVQNFPGILENFKKSLQSTFLIKLCSTVTKVSIQI